MEWREHWRILKDKIKKEKMNGNVGEKIKSTRLQQKKFFQRNKSRGKQKIQ